MVLDSDNKVPMFSRDPDDIHHHLRVQRPGCVIGLVCVTFLRCLSDPLAPGDGLSWSRLRLPMRALQPSLRPLPGVEGVLGDPSSRCPRCPLAGVVGGAIFALGDLAGEANGDASVDFKEPSGLDVPVLGAPSWRLVSLLALVFLAGLGVADFCLPAVGTDVSSVILSCVSPLEGTLAFVPVPRPRGWPGVAPTELFRGLRQEGTDFRGFCGVGVSSAVASPRLPLFFDLSTGTRRVRAGAGRASGALRF